MVDKNAFRPVAVETTDRLRSVACTAVDWKGVPRRTAGKMDKPLRVLCLWRAERDQKSPLRRCFKSRPSGRTRCAGFASGCWLIIGSV